MNTEPMKLERRSREWSKESCYHAMQVSGIQVTMEPGISWRHPEGGTVYVEARQCVYCKKLLPLEASKDSTESDIEVLAAEIAVMSDEEREAALGVDQTFAFGDGFDSTFTDRVNETFPDTIVYNSGEQAAWLAAQIILHIMHGDPR